MVSNTSLTNDMISKAQEYVLDIFNQTNDTRLVYHNYQRTAEITEQVARIARGDGVNKEATEIAQLAAWFHATGYMSDYERPVERSVINAQNFLKSNNCPEEKSKKILTCIQSCKPGETPKSEDQYLLSDAIKGLSMTTHFFHHRPLLRLEWELMQNRQLPAIEWNQIQLQELLNTKFYTDFGKKAYEPIIAQNILTQKNKVEKSKLTRYQMIDEKEGQLRIFQDIEKRMPSGAIQTYFRANYRNHINLSAIADNKANIMISVNAILISVVISILSYRNIPETNPMVLLPVVLFLCTGLISLIFAVLSIRPKVTSKNVGQITTEEAKKNIIFFGNFVTLKLEQYEEAMDAVFRDGELLYGNMVRDMYFLGKVLDKKYRFLTMSYNIFMVGFVATVITFLAAIFMN